MCLRIFPQPAGRWQSVDLKNIYKSVKKKRPQKSKKLAFLEKQNEMLDYYKYMIINIVAKTDDNIGEIYGTFMMMQSSIYTKNITKSFYGKSNTIGNF